jgi:hypothetical protein
MNQTLRMTINLIGRMASTATINGKQSRSDFLQSRIIIATSAPTLPAFLQKLWETLGVENKFGVQNVWATWRQNLESAHQVLAWLREYPSEAAMLATYRKAKGQSDEDFAEEFDAILDSIDLPQGLEDPGVALPSRSCNIPIQLTTLSDLVHGGDKKSGNAILFRTKGILTTTGTKVELPIYAANAFRGHIRDLLCDDYLQRLGLPIRGEDKGPLSSWFRFTLYEGGRLQENAPEIKTLGARLGNNGAVKTGGEIEFRNMIPPLSVWGCSLGNRTVSGRLEPKHFKPVCREWNNLQEGDVPHSAHELLSWDFKTRRNDFQTDEDEKNHSMIVAMQVLLEGSKLRGGCDYSVHATDIEIACLYHGISLWAENGKIGAMKSSSHGEVLVEYEVQDTTPYTEYLEEHKQDILAYLVDVGAIDPQYKEMRDAHDTPDLFSVA